MTFRCLPLLALTVVALTLATLCTPGSLQAQTATSSQAARASQTASQQWKQRQEKIQASYQAVMPAVVSITDGQSFGSGVVVSRDGLVMTAGHVIIESDREFTVMFPDGRSASAKPLGKNLNVDAGMMKLTDENEEGWPFAELGSGASVRMGDWVFALGHAGGYDLGRTPPLRVGRILRREREAFTTDCAIIGGDSGGPLFDLDGRVIGIHSSIGDSIAENRHVSVEMFLKDWDQLESGESWGTLPGTEPPRRRRRTPREEDENPGNRQPDESPEVPMANEGTAALGVELRQSDRRAVVRGIKENSAAARVGLREGDVVVSLDGTQIGSPAELVNLIASKRAGDVVQLKVVRNGQTLEYQIILGTL